MNKSVSRNNISHHLGIINQLLSIIIMTLASRITGRSLIRSLSIITYYTPPTYGFDYFSIYLLRIYTHAFPFYFSVGILIGVLVALFLNEEASNLKKNLCSLPIYFLGSFIGDFLNVVNEYNRLYTLNAFIGFGSAIHSLMPFFVILGVVLVLGGFAGKLIISLFPQKTSIIRLWGHRIIRNAYQHVKNTFNYDNALKIAKRIKNRLVLENKLSYILLIVILFAAATIRFYNISQLGLRYWDAALYIRKTIQFLDGGTTDQAFGHILILSAVFLLFGKDPLFALLLSAFIGTLNVYIIFLLGKELYDEKVGFLAASLLAVTEYHILYSRSALIQSDLAFFSLLTFYFYVLRSKVLTSKRASKKNKVLNSVSILSMISGLLAGFCFTITWIGIIIAPSILFIELFLIILKKIEWKKGLYFIGIFAISACLGSLMIFFPLIYFQRFIITHSTQEHIRVGILWGSTFNLFSFFSFLIMLVNPLFIALFLFGIVIIIKERKFEDLILVSWMIYFLIFFSGLPHKEPRDYISSISVFLLIAARGSFFLSNLKITNNIKAWKSKFLFLIFCSLLIISGFYTALDTITLESPAYKNSSEFLIQDNCQGGLAHMSSIMNVYTDLIWDHLGDKDKLIEAYQRGFTHMLIDYNYLWNKYGERDISQEILLKCPAVLILPNDISTHIPTLRESVPPDVVEEILIDPYSKNLYVYRLDDVIYTLSLI